MIILLMDMLEIIGSFETPLLFIVMLILVAPMLSGGLSVSLVKLLLSLVVIVMVLVIGSVLVVFEVV